MTETTTPRRRRSRKDPAADNLREILNERDHLKAQVAELTEKLAKAEQDVKRATDSSTNSAKERNEILAEMEQVHALIDALPGALPRTSDVEATAPHWSSTRRNAAMTRLASWLALR